MGSYTILERQKLRKMEEIEKKLDNLETKQEKEQRKKEFEKDNKKALKGELYNYFYNYFDKNKKYFIDCNLYKIKNYFLKLQSRNEVIKKIGENQEEYNFLNEIYETQLKKVYKYFEQDHNEHWNELDDKTQDFYKFLNYKKSKEKFEKVEKKAIEDAKRSLAIMGANPVQQKNNFKKLGLLGLINKLLGG